MASSIMHISVASELNKILKKDEKQLLIGTIAPDISKHIGENKLRSHFLDEVTNDVPNLELFLSKYKKHLNDDFVLGYYIHLYVDYLYFKYYLNEFYGKDCIYTKDGEIVKIAPGDAKKYIYEDYTNLNVQLIDIYNLELKVFYEKIPSFKDIITEIPMDKIQLIVDKAGIIIENSTYDKLYVFDITSIKKFIEVCVDAITNNLIELGIYKEEIEVI